jgi:hypothetical protein
MLYLGDVRQQDQRTEGGTIADRRWTTGIDSGLGEVSCKGTGNKRDGPSPIDEYCALTRESRVLCAQGSVDELAIAEVYFHAAQRRIGMLNHENSLTWAQCSFLTTVFLMSIMRLLAAWKCFVQAGNQCLI